MAEKYLTADEFIEKVMGVIDPREWSEDVWNSFVDGLLIDEPIIVRCPEMDT